MKHVYGQICTESDFTEWDDLAQRNRVAAADVGRIWRTSPANVSRGMAGASRGDGSATVT
jgi:hypothetical protein